MNSVVFNVNYHGKELKISTIYRKSGKELLFFIHGLGCAKESFINAWNFSKLEDYSLLAIDLLGFGESSKPPDFSYTMEEHAEICKLVLNKFKFKKIHIISHSMGGAIGLFLADKISNKFASFINVEGNLIAEDCGLLSRKTADVSYEEFKNKLFLQIKSVAKNTNDKGSELWYKWSEKSDHLGFYLSSVSLVKLSDSGELLTKFKELKCNKVYFYGDKSPVMKILKELRKFNDLKIISISNSGHFVMNDNPFEFYINLVRKLKN